MYLKLFCFFDRAPRYESAALGVCLRAVVLILSGISGTQAAAQSFFASNISEPAAGVDRGSTSGIRKLDTRTGFLTFDTYGSEDVGPYILGLGYVVPDLAVAGDQLDVVGVIAGPSVRDGLELQAYGIGYRFPLAMSGTVAFANASYSDVVLGTQESLSFDVAGDLFTSAIGVRRTAQLEGEARLTSTVEMVARRARGSVLGAPSIDEELRLLRVSTVYQQGLPNLFQRRFAAAVTVGLDGLGASPADNALASSPGATSEFVRASFSAETSIPFNEMWVVNAGVVGQFSPDSLPVSQRCGYGTNAYSRGFDQTYVLGDECIASRAEIAFNVQAPTLQSDSFSFTQAYFGVDYGRLWNNANGVLPSRTDQWSSGSLGLRTIQGDFAGEVALTRIFDQPMGAGQQDSYRAWVRAAIRF